LLNLYESGFKPGGFSGVFLEPGDKVVFLVNHDQEMSLEFFLQEVRPNELLEKILYKPHGGNSLTKSPNST
jgi:hypothetical protein